MDIVSRVPHVPPPGSLPTPGDPSVRPVPEPQAELDPDPGVVVELSGDGTEQAQRDRELAVLHGRLAGAHRREQAARAEQKRVREREQRGLSEDEEREVADLEAADGEVRAHEAAHIASGGGLTGAPTFITVQGPDGKSYAIGGQVSIQTSGDASEGELEQVRKAATAVPDMSSADARAASVASDQLASRQARAAETYEAVADASSPSGAGEP